MSTVEQSIFPLLPEGYRHEQKPYNFKWGSLPTDRKKLAHIYEYMCGDGVRPDPAYLQDWIIRLKGDAADGFCMVIIREGLKRHLIP